MRVTVTYDIPIEVIEKLIDETEQIFNEDIDYDEATDYILDELDVYIGEEVNYNHYDDLTVNTIYNLLYERYKK